MQPQAEFYIERLGLSVHPEGGYFKEIYRALESINETCLPVRYKESRNFSTSIYFLLEGEQTSQFHKLASDELWHFYDGSSVNIFLIDNTGELSIITLGRNITQGEKFQCIIPAGCWFGAELVDKKFFALVGCTVAPGFNFSDFVLSDKKGLIKEYPQHEALINRLNRGK
ncbi:MAG: cupin domain-containing protein [Ignavibacteriaceae bacterium]|nr:cupin domain-containing protein [Ignavibacteriaceae bacterium]